MEADREIGAGLFLLLLLALVGSLLAAGTLGYLLCQPAQAEGFDVLVGRGCGPRAEVMVALEEDELPVCAAIDVHHVAGRPNMQLDMK